MMKETTQDILARLSWEIEALKERVARLEAAPALVVDGSGSVTRVDQDEAEIEKMPEPPSREATLVYKRPRSSLLRPVDLPPPPWSVWGKGLGE